MMAPMSIKKMVQVLALLCALPSLALADDVKDKAGGKVKSTEQQAEHPAQDAKEKAKAPAKEAEKKAKDTPRKTVEDAKNKVKPKFP